MSFTVEVDFSPCYELVVSLYTYVHKPGHKGSESRKAWVKATRDQLNPKFAAELEDERLEVLHRILLLIWQCPGERNTTQFLQWLQDLTPGEIYERMIPWVRTFPDDMKSIRDRIVHLLSEWDVQYFRKIDPAILSQLDQDAHQKRKLQNHVSPADLIETATNGIRIEPTVSLKRVILVPQHHCAPSSVIDYYQELITCIYPVEWMTDDPEKPSNSLMRSIRTLADENRLQILRMLSKGKRSFTDVVNVSGLSKSNVHYHLAALRVAGLIRAHHTGERVESYSLRKEAIKLSQVELLSFITQADS